MNRYIDKYKGIHPGIVLERELKKISLKQRPFALAIDEHPQTLNAVTKGKRNLNTGLALKIETQLGLEEGTLVVLQAYYDVEQEKRKLTKSIPDLSRLRESLFWDTDILKIDWTQLYKAVIKRVFERGNETEKNEIRRFFGASKINSTLQSDPRNHKELA